MIAYYTQRTGLSRVLLSDAAHHVSVRVATKKRDSGEFEDPPEQRRAAMGWRNTINCETLPAFSHYMRINAFCLHKTTLGSKALFYIKLA